MTSTSRAAVMVTPGGEAGHPGGAAPGEPAPPRGSAALAVPAEACRVAAVRAWAATRMDTWGMDDDVKDAALLVISELSANAVRHGRTELSVLLSLTTKALRIEVADSGVRRSPDEAGPRPDEDEHGWGLGIVETLSDGVTTTRGDAGWWTRAWLLLDDCPMS